MVLAEKKSQVFFFQTSNIIEPFSRAAKAVCLVVCGKSRKLIHNERSKFRWQQEKKGRREEKERIS